MRRIKGYEIGLAALLAFTGSCAKHPSDNALANDIKARLFSDPDLRATNINVAVQNGAVTLSGDVPNADTELKAVKIANDAPGAKRVDDQIKVQGAQPAQGGSGAVASPNNPPGLGSQPAPPRPVSVTIPSGTPITIRMVDSVDSKTNTTGQQFRATLDDSIRVNGQVVAPRQSDVMVRLAQARGAGRIRGQSELELRLVKMTVNGADYPLTSNVYEEKGKARGKQTAIRTGIGAAAGALIGALAGGGRGAAVGAGVGGGGVAGYQIFTHGQQIRIPSETLLNFTLQAPVTMEAMPQ